ncbi:MAG: hypothetical protein Q8P68_02820 [Candidatus Peregrinibacteria bacterium]|nr:hypothetical protein [Candidatus Peregrinibacteria bacterium]MDZ4245228.1 hypothetical protein [Candidatus Gracilibacteria bacterium]
MKVVQVFLLISFVLFIGCANSNGKELYDNGSQEFCDTKKGYCLSAEKTFWGIGAWQESVGMSGQVVEHLTSNDVSIDSQLFTSIEIHHSPPSCGATTTGVVDGTVVEGVGNYAIWGKVFEEEKAPFSTYGDALCDYPNVPECNKDADYQNCMATNIGAYAFCSKQDEKRVVICISQQTDDPKMAEEIFKTFKWIK